jgi:hypothetical protein
VSACLYCRIDGSLVVGAYPSPRGLLLATGPEGALRKVQQAEGKPSYKSWHLPGLAALHGSIPRANEFVATFIEGLRTRYAGTSISFPDRVPFWNSDGRRA